MKTIPKAAVQPYRVAFGGQGKRLIVNRIGPRTATVWDVDKAEPIGKLNDVETVLTTSPDGQTWAIATTDYSVVLYDIASLQPVLELVGQLSEVTGAAFSPTEPSLATAARNGVVRLWLLQSGEPLLQFEGAGGGEGRRTIDLAFSADGNTLIAAESEQTKSARSAKIYAWRSVTPSGIDE